MMILNIDTATDYASVCLANDNEVIAEIICTDQKNHATFLQPAIEQLLQENNISMQQVDAIAVSAGPGSYTGLRVGLSTAKGLCYAMQKPLILCNTLQVMATAAIKNYLSEHTSPDQTVLFCPMIDARRMEIFTALYSIEGKEVVAPKAMILTEENFAGQLTNHEIYFSGNGSTKYQSLVSSTNAHFINVQHSAQHLAILAYESYINNHFADLAYSEPFYLKEFFTTAKALF